MAKQTLTDRKIKSLRAAPAGTRYELLDAVVPGLGVRVTDSGLRSFMLKTRYPGSRHPTRRALGEYPSMTLEEARERAGEWRKLIKRGIDPAVAEEDQRRAQQQKRANTFAAVAEDFIAEKLPGERKGREVAREIRINFGGVCPEDGYVKGAKNGDLLGPWPKRPITEISDLDVLAVVNAKKRTAPAQARNLLGIAKRFFEWSVHARTYGLTTSPARDLKPSKTIGKKRRRTRTLSNDELFALWRAAGRLPYPSGPVYRILMLTALRLNEAADASWSEFDSAVARAIRQRKDGEAIDWTKFGSDQLVWVIPEARMKGRDEEARAHAVPLTHDVLDILTRLPRFKSGLSLFSTTFGESPVWVSDKIKKRIDERMLLTMRALARRRGDDPAKVELAHWVNHDIRRTIRSGLSRLKVTEEAREAVMAHARPGIKGTYDHHDYLDEKREALEQWAARLRSVVSTPASNVVQLHPVRHLSL